MKYTIIISTAILVLSSCSSGTKDAQNIHDQINEYKSEITDIQNKIHNLEAKLEKDSMADDGFVYTVPVKTDTVKTSVFRHYFEIGGTVEAVQEAFISPEINGRISRIYVQEGQAVRQGDLLVKLNTDITENSIQEVETNLQLAEVMYQKQKELWDKNIGSEIQYLQAKTNKESLEARLNTMKAQLAMASIKAPFSGIVDQIFRKEGELAVPGMQLVRLINLGDILVSADVSESYIRFVKTGDVVSIEFPSYGKDRTEARISRTGDVISPNNRTFPIEMRLRNNQNRIKPNSLALVHINDYTNESAITVPSIIIKQDVSKGYFLFTASTGADGKAMAQRHLVVPGNSFGGRTEILSGLEPGDVVIVDGYNTVANGTHVEIR